MKLLLLIAVLLLAPSAVFGQARTAERIVSVPFSQLDPTGRLPDGEVRYVINGLQGSTPCTSGGTGALAMKIGGAWHCPKLTPGAGTGDVAGATASTNGELPVYAGTSGKTLGRTDTLSGVVVLTNGVVSTVASSGSGSVARTTTPTITAPILLTPTIGSFANAQHSHDGGVAGGQLNASNVFSTGTIPPARIISGAIINSRCLRVSNVGQIEVAAADCGIGGGGVPGGVSGNLIVNESGAFGGAANSAYDSATGRLLLIQKANGNDLLTLLRFTDTVPTGNLLRARNAANSADLFRLAVDGSITIISTITSTNTSAPSTPAAGNTVLWTGTADKNLKALDDAGNVTGTVRAITCPGTDKISAITSAGVPVCSADQIGGGGGGGGGLLTLNALSASDQTFAAVDDTNITLSVASLVSTHTFTVGWAGTLAKARQHAATAYVDQGNAWTAGAQSFAAATSLTVPTTAGASPASSGQIAFDSASNTLEAGVNGTNRTVAFTAGPQTFSDKTLDNSTTANLRDTSLTLQDNADPTKTVNFELAGIATGTNRVVTIPNANSVVVVPSTATANQWITHIDSAGVQQKVQPAFANLAGTLGEVQGGTGQTTVVQGDILFGSASNVWSRLPKSTTATRYLANTGASNSPQWNQVNLANGVTGILSDANLSANVSLLGPSVDLGSVEATGTLAAARFPALTGDVTTTAGSLATTIATDAVTNTKLADMATQTLKGRTAAGTGDPQDLTATQVTAMLNVATVTLKGLVPPPGVATGAFLRDDLTWVIPPGTGDMVLAAAQTVTGAKTFNDGTLALNGGDYGAADESLPSSPAEKTFYLNTNAGSRRLFIYNNAAYRALFQAGIDQVNLASANVTGVLPMASGGTNQTTWTASRCVQVNAAGTALESAAAACGSGGGGSGTVSSATVDQVAFYTASTTVGGHVGLTYSSTTGELLIGQPGDVGYLLTGRLVTAKTATYSVSYDDKNTFFTNSGAGGAITYTLPTPVIGLTYEFYRDANQTVTIDVAGSVTIRVGASATTAGGHLTLDAVGSRIRLVAISSTQWVGDSSGSVTFN